MRSSFLLFVSILTGIDGSQTIIGQDLSLAFGQKRLTTHALTEASLKKSTATAGVYTICSNYDQATTTQHYLSNNLGEDYYHPLYLSIKENTACFVAIVNDDTVVNLGDLEFIRSHTLTPPQLKIHESAFSLVELTHTDLSSSSIQENPYLSAFYRSSSGDSLLSRTKLVISFGVGVVDKHGVVNDRQNDFTLDAVQTKFSQRNPAQDLSALVDHATRHVDQGHQSLSLWENAIRDLNLVATSPHHSPEASVCPDHLITMEFSTQSLLVLENLKAFLDATPTSYRQSCVLSLLSHFLTTYSTTIADIRLSFPKFPNNHKNKGIVQTKTYSETYPYHTAGLDGTGQIVGVGDTGIDELSCFFRNADSSLVAKSSIYSPTFDLSKRKVIQYISYADGSERAGGHGTHVSGTIAGNFEPFVSTPPNYGGHAPGAKIAFFDMEKSASPNDGLYIPSPMATYVFQPAYTAGARIHSNSWGSPMNSYDSDDLTVDSFQYSHTDFLAIFAAGNDGSEGFYSIGSPGMTKNSLTVGASRSSSSSQISKVAYFSSLGPTFDERIKPDVVGPGYFTTSASANPTAASCTTVGMAGTSMATPLVAGVAAQLRQYFESSPVTTGCSLFTGSGSLSSTTCDNLSNPRGATIKAMIVHSGELMAQYDNGGTTTVQPSVTLGAAPDMYQGFGRVSLPNVLPYPGIETILKLHVVETEIYAYQEITHVVNVNDISRPFKATIVWMDPSNSVMSNKMLLNNIDLKVITPSGAVLHGNNVAGDEVNNVEQVSVLTPAVGQYTVVVTSAYLVTTSQAFSLIVTGGDLAFSSHDASAANTVAYNPNNCATNERYVVLTATDHGGNGWGAGNSFEIRDTSDNSLVLSGTLTAAAGEQFRKTIPVCLPTGKTYSVALITNGANSDEMGLDVSPCNAYLSKYLSSSTFSISTDSTLYCGQCPSQFKFEMILGGSFYGVPYGWRKESHYSLWNPTSGSSFAGTLVTGMYGVRYYCLPSGTWYLEYSDIPADDDGFITDDFWKTRFGVQEYSMMLSNGVTQIKIVSGQRATLSVSGTSASMSKSNAAPTLSPTHSSSPTRQPTVTPTSSPSFNPSVAPTRQPTVTPTTQPTLDPTFAPSSSPSVEPSVAPSRQPTVTPTIQPTTQPTPNDPTPDPTFAPSSSPSVEPSVAPSRQPTPAPPTADPTFAPSSSPSVEPSVAPSRQPTVTPTTQPTLDPTFAPSSSPSVEPSVAPSRQPTPAPPTADPTFAPSSSPSVEPTSAPSSDPTLLPTAFPSLEPTTPFPTVELTQPPTKPKGKQPKPPPIPPTARPSMEPLPTVSPSASPTTPTVSPTFAPTRPPTPVVTPSPTVFNVKTKKPKNPKNPKNPKSFFHPPK